MQKSSREPMRNRGHQGAKSTAHLAHRAELHKEAERTQEVKKRHRTIRDPANSVIELFARQTIKGWDCWGNETTKFNKGEK